MQQEELITCVQQGVQKAINGDLRDMKRKIEDHINHHDINDRAIFEFQKRIEPFIENFEGAARTGRIVVFIGTIITAIAGSILVLKQLFK